MKKVILSLIIIVLVLVGLAGGFYYLNDKPVSADSEVVSFEIKPGTGKTKIIDDLYAKELIKNKYAGYIYMFLNARLNMQAGKYNINKSDKMSDILKQISKGDTKRTAETVRITFREGKIIDEYAQIIAANIKGITEEDFLNAVKDKEFLKLMIDKYWFLTDDILKEGIRYPLEGYLFPQTYDFYVSANSKDIIKIFLNQTEKVLNKYKEDIESSKYSVHELLTIASICEKEANSKEDRKDVSQVIYTRLSKKMFLGMDATTYYSARKKMTEALTKKDLAIVDGYNTRYVKKVGLPVGAICNPGEVSIDAALYPNDGKYVYFYAVNGKDYFFETYPEFKQFQNNLKS